MRGVPAPQMSDSYPTLSDVLSQVQKDFMGCVEMHLDPPEDDPRSYAVKSLYTYRNATRAGLPGDSIRFSLAVDASQSERRHTIEFIDEADEARGWVRHSMKRCEAGNGRYVWTESRFEVEAPDLPQGTADASEVEREVQVVVDRIRVLDRSRSLIEL